MTRADGEIEVFTRRSPSSLHLAVVVKQLEPGQARVSHVEGEGKHTTCLENHERCSKGTGGRFALWTIPREPL